MQNTTEDLSKIFNPSDFEDLGATFSPTQLPPAPIGI